jgi:preprotein translocase subunit YajC
MSFPVLLAQVTNAVNDAVAASPDAATPPPDRPIWTYFLMYGLLIAMVYFAFFRPQIQAKKKQEETIKTAKTGDRIVTSSGIHGVITNVKETTVIVKIADNVKIEVEKTHIDRVTRDSAPEKAAAKA